MSEIKNILVLGGAGFLGINFLEELLHGQASKNYNITVFSRSRTALLDKMIEGHKNVKVVTGNYRNINEVEVK